MEKKYSDKELIKGIRDHDKTILTYMYEEFYPLISSFVIENMGSTEDAEDVFQEVIVSLFKSIRDHTYKQDCSLKTYIYSIGKKYWWYMYRTQKTRAKYTLKGNDTAKEQEQETGKALITGVIFKHFIRLKEECKKLIRYILKGFSNEQIGEKMRYSTIGYTKKRKYHCRKTLVHQIASDPLYKSIRGSLL